MTVEKEGLLEINDARDDWFKVKIPVHDDSKTK